MSTSVSTRTSGSVNPTRQQLDELDALLKRMLELPVNQLEEAERAAAEAEAEAEQTNEEPPPPPAPVAAPPVMEPALPPEPSAVSYMVVETASPRPLPPASGFEPRPSPLTPHRVAEMPEEAARQALEPPVPDTEEADEGGPDESEVWVPLRSTWQPSPQTWPPLADSWHQAHGTAAPSDSQQEALPREILVPQPSTPPAPLPIESVQRSISLSEPVTALSQDKASATPVSSATPTPTEPRLSLTADDAPVVVPRAVLPLLWFNQGFDACMAPLGAVGRWLSSHRGRQTLGIAGLALLAIAVGLALGAGMTWTR